MCKASGIYSCTRPPIRGSMDRSIHQSTNQSINQPIDTSLLPSIHGPSDAPMPTPPSADSPSLPFNQSSLHQAINPLVNQSRKQSIEATVCFMAAAGCVLRSGPWNQSPTLKVYSSYHVVFTNSNTCQNIPACFKHFQYI